MSAFIDEFSFAISPEQELDGLDEKASANVLIMRQQKMLQDAKKVQLC